jgi:hypothetical protein
MAYPLKNFSQLQIEEALANALTTLTGANYKVNIHKMEFTDNCLFDKNAIELTTESDFCCLSKEEETGTAVA